MGRKLRRSLLLVLGLLAIAVFGMTAFAYETADDDGDRKNQNDISMHKVYTTAGMLRIVDDGTVVSLSADKKAIDVEATTSTSKTWGKITKLAFIDQTATEEEKNQAATAITFADATFFEDEAVYRNISFSIPLADIGKKIPVCRYQAGKWTDFTEQAYLIVLMTDGLYDEISAAIETETDDDVKADLQATLDNFALASSGYMFSPQSVVLVEDENGWLVRIIYGKATYTKAFLGYVSQALVDDAAAIPFEGEDGRIKIPVAELKTNLPIAFASAKNGYGAQRDMVIDKAQKTASFEKSEDVLLKNAKEDAIEALEEQYNADKYSGDEKAAIEKILADAKTAIEEAKTVDEVGTAKAAAEKDASPVKTDAKKAEEKAAADKAAADKAAADKAAADKAAADKAAADKAAKEAFEAIKVKAKKPKAAKKSFTAKWNGVQGAEGYEVKYGLNKKVTKKAKTKTVNTPSSKSVKIKKLKAKKTYYVIIRAYKTINNVKCYTKWSAVKKVKTK